MMADRRPTTQKQLADMLGLSTATVSLALRDSPMISEETRRLVRETVRMTGYVYNVAAASLRTGTTRLVGVSFHNIVHSFFAEMLTTIDDTLSENGKAVVINNHGDDPARQLRFIETLRSHGADGLIVSPALGTAPEDFEPLRRAGVAIICLSRRLSGLEADFVGNDDVVGMQLAVDRLIALGHRHIVMLGGLPGTSSHDLRLEGFRQAIAAAGIEWRDELHLPGAANRVVGMQLAREALAARKRPTAFACFNDLIAFGALNAIRAAGLEPAKDVAVIGMDDTEEARACYPALTTVSNRSQEIGAAAAGLLIDRLDHPRAPFQSIAIRPTLTIRESCGGTIAV